MFSRNTTRTLLRQFSTNTTKVAFTNRKQFSTKIPTNNAWLGPKLKRTLLYSGGVGSFAGLFYYLSSDPERNVDVSAFGEHERVPYLALHPERGGVKNLPISTHFIDENQDAKNEKPRLVIIGSGWGSISTVKNLDKDKYNVTIISENNYFLFSPLLPSSTVGTLELR